LGGAAIPLDADAMLTINFVGPPATFPAATLSEALDAAGQQQPMPMARGAIVIIGIISQGSQDVHNTPFSNRYADYVHREGGGLMSRPELHANIVATLHDRAFITTPWWLWSLLWLLILGVVLGLAFFRVGRVQDPRAGGVRHASAADSSAKAKPERREFPQRSRPCRLS